MTAALVLVASYLLGSIPFSYLVARQRGVDVRKVGSGKKSAVEIVEQAQLTLQDPKGLTSERQRLIIALARFISSEMSHPSPNGAGLDGVAGAAPKA